jgi:hypothetical protein
MSQPEHAPKWSPNARWSRKNMIFQNLASGRLEQQSALLDIAHADRTPVAQIA